jgi:hypothetical protein
MMHADFGLGYSGWAHCGLGSTVTTEDVRLMAPGIRMVSSTSMTLCALDAAKATVDMVVRNRIEGGSLSMPPTEILQEIEIPAAPSPPEPRSWSKSGSNADGTRWIAEASHTPFPTDGPPAEEGQESLLIAGREIPCRWTRRVMETVAGRITFKTWHSDLIPGGVARFEAQVEGQPERNSTTTVVSFLKK